MPFGNSKQKMHTDGIRVYARPGIAEGPAFGTAIKALWGRWDSSVREYVVHNSQNQNWVKLIVVSLETAESEEYNEYTFLVRYDPTHEEKFILVRESDNLSKEALEPKPEVGVEQSLADIRRMKAANRARQAVDVEELKVHLNNYIKTVPQDTLERKKLLSDWINAEVSMYGLAVECPDTPGLPVEVKGDRGNRPSCGRFQFSPLISTGDRKRVKSHDVMPVLNFIPRVNTINLSAYESIQSKSLGR